MDGNSDANIAHGLQALLDAMDAAEEENDTRYNYSEIKYKYKLH